jgi:transposase
MKTNQTYTPEFRAEAVKLVLDQGLSQQQAAERLGIPKGSLGNWVASSRQRAAARVQVGEATLEELKAEVARLRKELARAEMEREIVKKAAAYFAKESLQGTRS